MTSPTVIGRHPELERLAAVLDEAVTSGSGRLVLVAGEAGVGKTRLLQAATADAVAQGVRVVSVGCIDGGAEILPLAPVVGLVRELQRQLSPTLFERVLGPTRAELVRLVPELRPAEHAQTPEAAQLAEGVRSSVLRLADEGPVLLVVEDLHWSDRTTRDIWSHVAASLPLAPVVLVGTYRSDAMHRRHPLLATLTELQRSARPERIDLQPFEHDDVAALMQAIEGVEPDHMLVDSVYRRTGGNAFFLEELLAAGASSREVPAALRDVVLGRTADFDDDTLAVARAAGVIGSPIGHDVLSSATGMTEPRLGTAVRILVDGHVLVAGASAYSFRHELVREVFADDVLPGERAALHRSIAAALEDAGPEHVGRAARHWAAGADLPAAVRTSMLAGRRDQESGASAEALAHYERLLDLWDAVPDAARRAGAQRHEVLRRAAESAAHFGDLRRAVELGRAATQEQDGGDPAELGMAWLQLAQWMWDGAVPGMEAALATAADLVPEAPPSEERAAVLARLAGVSMLGGDDTGAVESARAAIDVATEVGSRRYEAHARNTLGTSTANMGDVSGIDELRASLDIAAEIEDLWGIARGHVNLSFILHRFGRFADAVDVAKRGRVLLRERNAGADLEWRLVGNELSALLRLGTWDDADVLLADFARYHGAAGSSESSHALYSWARVMVWRGESASARPVLEQALERERTGYYSGCLGGIAAGLIELDLADGSAVERDLVDDAIALLLPGQEDEAVELVATAVRALADEATSHRRRGAVPSVDEFAATADGWMDVVSEAVAARSAQGGLAADHEAWWTQCRAERRRLEGSGDPVSWARVADLWDAAHHPWCGAYARWRQAEALLVGRTDRAVSAVRSDAGPLIGAAWTGARALDAKPLMAEIADLAGRARIALPDAGSDADEPEAPGDDPFGLTPREREVLSCVAAGLSNGQIGQELFISTKTASVHVSNILRKLQAANRIAAAAVAREAGLVPR